jgi:hypothetical protein
MSGMNTESGIPQAFDWLKLAVDISRQQPKTSIPPTEKDSSPGEKEEEDRKLPDQTSPRTPGNLASKLDSWLARLGEDSTPEELLRQFKDIALSKWDHYIHIRLAYHILQIHGRQKGSLFLMT